MNDLYILITAFLVAINAAILGSFLLLRKNVMIGDAISHAVLPGIFFAYFFSNSVSEFPMLIGAAVSGVLATWLIELLIKKARVQSDSAIGISYTFLFSIGVILISMFGKNIDLDQSCVLYGELEYIPLNMISLDVFEIPKPTLWLFVVFLAITGLVSLFYKPLLITTFDPTFAKSIGVNVVFWHYFLLSGVSINTVVSFEAVGAILVVSFLAGPPAIAYLVTQRLKPMILVACGAGMLASLIGYYVAMFFDFSIAGSISVTIGILLLLVFLSQKAWQMLRKRVVLMD